MGLGGSKGPVTLEYLSENLSNGHFKNIIVMCGAGVSTNAGIPDFRSPSAGLYFKLRSNKALPYPEAVFDGGFFMENPRPFYDLARDVFPAVLRPTDTHKFFTLLNNKGILKRVYTQNIDTLESLAGLPPEKLVEAHGSFRVSHCLSCKEEFDMKYMKEAIFDVESNDGIPKCNKCRSNIKPDVVLFGEALPERFWACMRRDFEQCDCLLIFGTSLAVSPFNALPCKVPKETPRIFINKSKPGSIGFLGWIIGLGRNATTLDGQNDLVHLGDCDETVQKICADCGWLDELNNIPIQSLET